MKREYDLFEQLPDGSPIWRGHVSGIEEAGVKLREIAAGTTNACFAVHLATMEVAARANVRGSAQSSGAESTAGSRHLESCES